MKRKTFRLIMLALLTAVALPIRAQGDDFLEKINTRLNEGNCESAQRIYNAYKEASKRTDKNIERLINECQSKRDSTGGQATPQNGQDFTETAFGINMRMIFVEGGTFTMGCTSEQGGECWSDEKPTRETTVGSFHIGMLEVTQSQWEKVMGTSLDQQRSKAGDSKTYGVGADYPMYYVSWEEANEFCRRLSRQTGRNYSLPTEAEWEYAARGGNRNEGTKYSGSSIVDDVAWYSSNSNSTTHLCGTKLPNALDIYDMSGNVWEWCEDWCGDYQQYDKNNPKGPSSGSFHRVRGGCWKFSASCCRVAFRNSGGGGRSSCHGFRVVCHLLLRRHQSY